MNIRQVRMQKLFNSIQMCSNNGNPASKKKLLAYLSMTYGTSRRTALEYLQTLIDSDKVVLKGDELWTPQSQKLK